MTEILGVITPSSYAQFSKNPLTQGLKPKDWDIFYLVGNHRLKYSVVIIGARGPTGPRARAPRGLGPQGGFRPYGASGPKGVLGSKGVLGAKGLGLQKALGPSGPRGPEGPRAQGA